MKQTLKDAVFLAFLITAYPFLLLFTHARMRRAELKLWDLRDRMEDWADR